jgi:hypothetical protein
MGPVASNFPVFKVRGTDWNGDQIMFRIEVTQGTTTRTFETGYVNSGEEATFPVPEGQPLGPGEWTWRAQAVDAYGGTSDWSAPGVFQVPTLPDAASRTGLNTFGVPLSPSPEGQGTRDAGRGTRDSGTLGTLGTLGTSPGWNVRLQAQTASGAAEVILGETSPGRALAVGVPPEPPAGGNGVRLALLRDGQPLAVDVRPRTVGKQAWEFVVEPVNSGTLGTSGASEVILTWPDLRSVPADVSLTLVDAATGARRSLRTTTHYAYRPTRAETSRRFQILAEPKPGLGLQVLDLRAELGRGGGWQVRFTLNRAAETTVVVWSLNGREVADVERQRSRSLGMNIVAWDGRDAQSRPLPPGVYLVEVQAVDEEGRAVSAVRSVALR